MPSDDETMTGPGPGGGDVEAVIVNYKSADEVAALCGVLGECPSIRRVVVVDNSGEMPDPAGEGRVTVLRPDRNLGFGCGVNAGMEQVVGGFALVINPDTAPTVGGLERLFSTARAEDAVVMPMLVDTQRMPTRSQFIPAWDLSYLTRRNVRLGAGAVRFEPPEGVVDVQTLSGACFVAPVHLFRAAGGFDTRIFMYGEDILLGKKVQALGGRLVADCRVQLVHEGGGTQRRALRDRLRRMYRTSRGEAMALAISASRGPVYQTAVATWLMGTLGLGLVLRAARRRLVVPAGRNAR